MQPKVPTFICAECGAPATPWSWRCDACGEGTLEIRDIPPFDAGRILHHEWSLWRYAAMLPFARIVSLGEGMTPLTRITLDDAPVYAKLDFLQPTGSYKDRGTVGVLNGIAAIAAGMRPNPRVIETSSGNAGASVAAYATAAGLQARIFVPAGASAAKKHMIAAYGAEVVEVPGSKADVTAATVAALGPHAVFASHSHSPLFIAGMMTLAWELWEQMDGAPDAVVMPVGMACLFLGVARGFAALYAAGKITRVPRLFAVQTPASDPIVRAWEQDLDHVPPLDRAGKTVADGIVIPAPLRGKEIMRTLRDTGGAAIRVAEESILPARDKLAAQGLYVEPTSATTAAALPQIRALTGKDARLVLVLTGSGLKAFLAAANERIWTRIREILAGGNHLDGVTPFSGAQSAAPGVDSPTA